MEVLGQRVDSVPKGEEVLRGFIARDLCGAAVNAALPLSIQAGRELPSLPQGMKSEGRPSAHGNSEASGTTGSRKESDSQIHESLRKETAKRRMWEVLRV